MLDWLFDGSVGTYKRLLEYLLWAKERTDDLNTFIREELRLDIEEEGDFSGRTKFERVADAYREQPLDIRPFIPRYPGDKEPGQEYFVLGPRAGKRGGNWVGWGYTQEGDPVDRVDYAARDHDIRIMRAFSPKNWRYTIYYQYTAHVLLIRDLARCIRRRIVRAIDIDGVLDVIANIRLAMGLIEHFDMSMPDDGGVMGLTDAFFRMLERKMEMPYMDKFEIEQVKPEHFIRLRPYPEEPEDKIARHRQLWTTIKDWGRVRYRYVTLDGQRFI